MGGALLEAFGGPNTFYGAAVAATLTGLYYFLTQLYIRYKERQHDKRQPPIDDHYPTGLIGYHTTWCKARCG